MKAVAWIGVSGFTLIGLVVGIVVLAFALSWCNAGAKIISPDNVREQYRYFYDTINALDAIELNVCTTQAIRDKEPDAFVRAQRDSQIAAYQQQYNRLAAQYDARAQDVFRARVVRPRDLPATAPPLRLDCPVTP